LAVFLLAAGASSALMLLLLSSIGEYIVRWLKAGVTITQEFFRSVHYFATQVCLNNAQEQVSFCSLDLSNLHLLSDLNISICGSRFSDGECERHRKWPCTSPWESNLHPSRYHGVFLASDSLLGYPDYQVCPVLWVHAVLAADI
jgi:hypothetical protein